ncbi:tail assembly chaperone [Gordonia phage Catfish]|uniref:Tail assembly chaperone n=1 Tax=Gordonia phage Catfish TaxID=2301538 RepID=A0A385D0V1_9CAUD|nr:tail assembly chaperone [Gordonia phage Catfish]AXQ51855.1 tail assembly chaperone [Gordonia phage Catfish]
MATYDLGEMVQQRAEAAGLKDGSLVEFSFGGESFEIPHPLFADDDFKDDLALVESDVDLAVQYLGEEQYERFRAVGGKSGFVGILIERIVKDASDSDADGNPTRSRRSSARGLKRQKQR